MTTDLLHSNKLDSGHLEPGDEVTFEEIESGYKVIKEAPTTESGDDPFVKYRGSAESDAAMPERMRRLRGEYPRETVDADYDDDGA